MSTTPDFAEYEAKIAAMSALQADILPLNKAALFDALAAAGIGSVTVCFDGSGDSGQIESADGFDAENNFVEFPATTIDLREVVFDGPTVTIAPRSVREVIEIMAYEFLAQTHRGWENEDGAYGEFTFDVAARTITLDYNERYTESTNTMHEF